ncbi:MAG: hypothetical protein ACTSX6_03315 [Candidatus Heimdallarchaeaceae archaeon]
MEVYILRKKSPEEVSERVRRIMPEEMIENIIKKKYLARTDLTYQSLDDINWNDFIRDFMLEKGISNYEGRYSIHKKIFPNKVGEMIWEGYVFEDV